MNTITYVTHERRFVFWVQVAAGYVFHVGQVQGVLKVGDKVMASIDSKRRYRIAANHTMTHVLNYGLREVSLAIHHSLNRQSCSTFCSLEE
jgi:alanyl-tRNA synthetase